MSENKLTKPEQIELLKQERILEQGFFHMRNAAEALRIIRDKRLYRGDGFKTFQDYCERKWGKERTTVHKMLAAYEAREAIVEHVQHEKPLKTLVEHTSERAIREISKVPKRSLKRVLKAAVKTTKGKLTAVAVRHAVQDEIKRNGPCAEFGDGRTYHGKSLADFYCNGPSNTATATTAIKTVMVSLNKVLEAYDREIEKNILRYAGKQDMAERIRTVLSALG